MNHINYIIRNRGDLVKYFRETGWVSQSKIVTDGIKGDVNR